MPNQLRPVSPVALETCSPPPADSDQNPYELLGSDDELDDLARAAKRQRIEKLAEAYLRGRPLFIASAALRGPFDEGWKNPWKKKRKILTKSDAKLSVTDSGVRNGTHGTIVQETDVRNKRYKTDLAGPSRPTVSASPIIPASPSATLIDNRPTSLPPKSGQKRPSSTACAESSRASPRLPKRSKERPQLEVDATFAEPASISWLKKDRRRMNFKSFEPPSSPTPKSDHSGWEIGPRPREPRSVAPVSSHASSNLVTPAAATFSERLPQKATTKAPPQVVRPPAQGPHRSPIAAIPSPSRMASPSCEKQDSFRVVSSTSQLARFEYRLRAPVSSTRSKFNSPAAENVAAKPSAPADEGRHAVALEQIEVAEPVHSAEPEATGNGSNEPEKAGQEIGQHINLSKSLRFANDTDGTTFTSTCLPTTSEKNTYDELPSAQQVAVLPGLSDRVPSLHSTIVPKENSKTHGHTSPDTQLSTQAALLHAQKSFQDDLESPAQYGITPAPQRAMANVGDESLLAQETPLFRPDTSERALPHSFRVPETRQSEKSKMQAMSTQCMIDAATPFTFSTDKKSRAFRSISPRKTSPVKPRAIHTAEAPSPITSSPISVFDPDSYTAQHQLESSHPPSAHSPPPDHTSIHPSTTEGTSLPFVLSESTPTTAQDGQGGLQNADSFNLSQAIADAGSWLQQSFK
ncbi:uncharacterized protein N7484_004128 [Penicillium longicatenatum]|uniref:uncharacterized protein n=1 Tax=Penicillium longicatenatum TaxID=1561947 RepID=UPI0025469913|nr:uncharacterized protein N7484_004128 [Penicillium longicatenatum]KAJ5650405.1 hypothetical protein N7484_004128 [Penicillium longicatenatum]